MKRVDSDPSGSGAGPTSGAGSQGAPGLDRRGFLFGSGALVLGVGLVACAPGRRVATLFKADEALEAVDGPPPTALNAFVRIGRDDVVTVLSKHLEMGQGPYTAHATLVAEELGADWSQMRVEAAPSDDAVYANNFMKVQGTGGSTAVAESYLQMRRVGAAAREMLVRAAADAWGVPAAGIIVRQGVVSHAASGRRARFGELVEAAAALPVPEAPALKSPEDFVLIGHELPRIDSAAKSNGTARFTMDEYREDMLVVMIARPPSFGAKVARFDAGAALDVPGVVHVREVPQGVAVYAEETWAAIQGRRALVVEWDESASEKRSTEQIFAACREAARGEGIRAASRGDAAAEIARAKADGDVFTTDAEYLFPYLAHAPMEPLDAVLENAKGSRGERVIATLGCQGPGRDHPAIARALGLPREQVEIETLMAGGSFGRRSQHDAHFPVEAADVFRLQPGAPAERRPTKLVWTREDDVQGGYYRPIMVHRLSGAMNRKGELLAWRQAIAGQSFFYGTGLEARLPANGVDRTMTEGATDLPYATGHLQVTQHAVPTGVPVLWWRSVGHTHTGFAAEAFIDELLEGAGRDAVEGRLALLADHPRKQRVLRHAAEAADWGRAPSPGCAFGVAVHESFRSCVAQIAEVEVAPVGGRRPKVRRVWCAVDCGLAVNPNVIRAQMEGGIGFGLGAALYSEIELAEGGRVRQRNFDAYHALRLDDMPEVEVLIVPSDAPPTGVGEPGVPPIAPAVANAWRRLTGDRVSRLPFVRKA